MADRGFVWNTTPLDQLVTQAKSTIAERNQQFPYDVNVEGLTYTPVLPSGRTGDGTPPGLSEAELASYSAAMVGSWEEVISVEVLGATLETSADGCVTEGRIAVYGSLDVAYFVESEGPNAITRAANLARRSPEVVPVLESWSECMSERGYLFDDFTYARSAGLASPEGGQDIANADSECTNQVDLLSAFNREFSAQLAVFQDEHLGELERLGAARALAVERAKALLGAG